MTDRCPTGFDRALISGYLDRELRQSDEQKVRNHLEDCARCGALHEELSELREATMTTRFSEPDDTQWDERPRGAVSRASLGLGWLMTIVWAVAVAGFGLWQAWQATADLFVKLLIFGGVAGFFLLFLSILIDRLKTAGDDPYREVQK